MGRVSSLVIGCIHIVTERNSILASRRSCALQKMHDAVGKPGNVVLFELDLERTISFVFLIFAVCGWC